ncbi:MAG: tetratricopeptide repeat protein [bacterium]|nr:tetratricopeptide repeat protein [bacterium]
MSKRRHTSSTTPISKATFATGLFLLAHLLLAHWQSPYPFWGLDLLAYYPAWLQIPFTLFAAFLLLPPTRARLLQLFEKLTPLLNHSIGRATLSFILILALATLFYSFRSAVHLLGDGYLYLRELDNAIWNEIPRVDRAPLSFWIIRTLHNLGGSALTTYRIYSFASGLFYLALIFPIARTLGRNRTEAVAIGTFLLSAGFLQLFCGYVENYALLLPALLLYLLAGLRALQNQLSPWVPALALALFLPLHFALVAFLPSLAFLLWQSKKPAHFPDFAKTFAPLVSLMLVPLVLFVFLDIHLFTYFNKLAGGHLLPLFAEPNFYQPYRLFSLAHMLDVLNQQFLAAPAACLVLFCFYKRKGRDPQSLFLCTATLFPFLFTFLANPEIGAFRDWDIFTLPALPFTLWAARHIAIQIPNRTHLTHVILLFCGAAALHTALWVGLNANTEAAEHRFKNLLSHTQLSKHAGSYGWEILGRYYRLQKQSGKSLEAYRSALEANPNNYRHWIAVGNAYCDINQYDRGLIHLKKAAELQPEFAPTYSNIGVACLRLGQYQEALVYLKKAAELDDGIATVHSNLAMAYQALDQPDKAIEHLEKAITLKPDFADAHANLGAIYHHMDQPEKAIEHLEKAIALNPRLADAFMYMNLGAAYQILKQYDSAIQYLQKASTLNPNLADVYFNLGAAYVMYNQPDKARDSFRTFLRLAPNDPQAPRLRAWLRANPSP